MPDGMQRLNVDITQELAEAIRWACPGQPFGPCVEEWLWKVPEIKQAARDQGIQRKRRRYVGEANRKRVD